MTIVFLQVSLTKKRMDDNYRYKNAPMDLTVKKDKSHETIGFTIWRYEHTIFFFPERKCKEKI